VTFRKTFNSVTIITLAVPRLRAFYQAVLQQAGEGDEAFVVFSIQGLKLSLCSTALVEGMAPGAVTDAGSGRCVLEFEVEDVDREYERLKHLAVSFVKPPTTQPWGLRSVWFRDPDGHLINFYASAASGQNALA
jgi:catechol 2,3-dioxygenase-like lactoylglutathione lyase family enzyme